MIRVVLFLVAVALVAAGLAWMADRPGDVAIVWMGYRIETSLMVAALAVAGVAVAAVILWSILRGIVRSPEQVSLFFRHRRAMKGYHAISRGLVAIGAGDAKAARKAAGEAARLSPGDPLTLLLTAQAAQMAGDRAGAERAFRTMAGRDDTRLLGLRGLYIEAQRTDDVQTARAVAEQAAKAAPELTWAGHAVLDDRCAAADWAGALEALEHMRDGLDKADYRRKRAVLLTARALALEEIDRDASRTAVLEAVKLAPDLVPAVALAGKRLAESNEQRRARRMLEKAWMLKPHPDIAEAFANLRLGDSARERLARVTSLAEKTPGEREGALAVARAALDAREFAVAREALAPYLAAPTQRVAALMAEIEEAEHGDEGRVREWMSRAVRAAGDPVWTADGVVSERWQPVSPRGRLDGYEWRVPLAEIGVTRPVIEVSPPPPPLPAAEPVEIAPPVAAPEVTAEAASLPEPAPSEPPPPVVTPVADPVVKPAVKPVAKPKPAEPVIPLVHAPDDPGGDLGLDREPVPEPTTPPSPWQRVARLFR